MRRALAVVLTATMFAAFPSAQTTGERARLEARAQNVTIQRDDWGIPHVVGKTDGDAVFGALYAQAEDDFNRVETNFLTSLGRTAEAEGERALMQDLRQRLFLDPLELKTMYARAPAWLQKLMDGWADGLNYFLLTHPDVKPKVITHFEPWMALSFSEGSIGGDIEKVNLTELGAFYNGQPKPPAPSDDDVVAYQEPTGSNGFAFAPSNTASKHAILWINPHTSFFFREELQMTSGEGLNAYGASTWGQFFIYQGFNETAGWMHTTSGVDNIDEYLETVTKQGHGWTYKYGNEQRKVTERQITLSYKTATGTAQKTFTVYDTHHGPVVRTEGDAWVSVRMMNEPLKALQQSYGRTKAKNYAEFVTWMDQHTNSSNNTLFADAEGNIAYLHSNFIPRRSTTFDWTKPVDGSNPETEWNGVLSFDETPNVIKPASGWVYNTNNAPWSASGSNSPKKDAYPAYVEKGGENARGVHALRVLPAKKDFTIDTVRDAAFDSYLPMFASMVPALVTAYDALPSSDARKAKLAAPMEAMRAWDFRWDLTSVPTTLAVFWGEQLGRNTARSAREAGLSADAYIETKATPAERLDAFVQAVDRATTDFGKWNTPWGDVNRFQRLTSDIVQPFDDKGPSIPVAFTSARWGSLASFGANTFRGSKKMYGTSGNSFVAGVEFGPKVKAKAVTAGGLNSNPKSPHFNDQAERYATGNLRDVYFYPEQLKGHSSAPYHPGTK